MNYELGHCGQVFSASDCQIGGWQFKSGMSSLLKPTLAKNKAVHIGFET